MIHTMFTSVFCIFTTGKMYSRVSKMKTYLLSTDQQKPLQIETALFFFHSSFIKWTVQKAYTRAKTITCNQTCFVLQSLVFF